MAQSQSGKWVSRVASTGGGRTYRSQRPRGFYAAIIIIVVLGTLSVAFARHEHRSSAAATTTTAVSPAVGTTSYAALAFDVCGRLQQSLQPSPSSPVVPISALSGGVVRMAPKTAATAGTNATVRLFANDYPGLVITSSVLTIPSSPTSPAIKTTYRSGQTCPSGTPDAGKAGVITISYWRNFAVRAPTVSSNSSAIHFSSSSLVTVGFLPAGTRASKPSSSTVNQMLSQSQQSTTTTSAATATTLLPATTTSPATSTTLAPVTTTTKKK